MAGELALRVPGRISAECEERRGEHQITDRQRKRAISQRVGRRRGQSQMRGRVNQARQHIESEQVIDIISLHALYRLLKGAHQPQYGKYGSLTRPPPSTLD